ncbi:MAG: hypothetical protein RLY16_1229 [Bacteroidota bacterium]|jgi:peptidyl-prolyl cis-trans isomerase D
MLKNSLLSLLLLLSGISAIAQKLSIAQHKIKLEQATNPFAYVQTVMKKKFKVDTVSVFHLTNFVGLADSLACKGKIGKVYGPFKQNNILIQVLAKLPNRFYHVKHIVIDTGVFKKQFADSMADKIITRILSGANSFEEMAASYSADLYSAPKGGDLGWFAKGAMLPQLDEVIEQHRKTDIFKLWSPAGLHIIYLPDAPKKQDGHALLLRVFL